MKDFAGRVAFITGGASGVGFAQAQVFGEAGCRIALADIRDEPLAEAVERLRSNDVEVEGFVLDVADREAYRRVADEVETRFGDGVSLLCNTAGAHGFGRAETLTYDDFDWIVGVNFGGVLNGMMTFVPRMIERGGGGHIITVSSMGGFEGGALTAPYSASKAATTSLMESYGQALSDHGIGVSVVCPANIRSGFAESFRTRDRIADSGLDTSDTFITKVHEVHSHGMDPVVLARHVKAAVERDQLHVLPYPEVRADLERIFGRLMDAVPDDDPLDPEGPARRLEALAAFRRATGR